MVQIPSFIHSGMSSLAPCGWGLKLIFNNVCFLLLLNLTGWHLAHACHSESSSKAISGRFHSGLFSQRGGIRTLHSWSERGRKQIRHRTIRSSWRSNVKSFLHSMGAVRRVYLNSSALSLPSSSVRHQNSAHIWLWGSLLTRHFILF